MDDPIAEFIQWYKTRPIITKTYLTISTILAILLRFTGITVVEIFYSFEYGFSKMELWRIFTNVFYIAPLSFSFLIEAYFAYFALYYAETQIFQKERKADYWMLIIYNYSIILILASIYDIYFLSNSLFFALIYIWCKAKPFMEVQFFLGIKVTSGYLPWVYLGLFVLMQQPFISLVYGFLSGHLYVYVKGTLFEKYNIDFMPTPGFLKRFAALYQDSERIAENPFVNEQVDEDEHFQ